MRFAAGVWRLPKTALPSETIRVRQEGFWTAFSSWARADRNQRFADETAMDIPAGFAQNCPSLVSWEPQ